MMILSVHFSNSESGHLKKKEKKVGLIKDIKSNSLIQGMGLLFEAIVSHS